MGKLLLGEDVLLHDGRFVQLIKRPFTTEAGESGHWEFVRRKVHGRIVAVVALTPERQIVLVKIFRVPLNAYIIEPCAGLADQPGEDEVVLARRELLEETGYQCDDLRPIMAGPFNAGLNADEIVFYFGTNARLVAKPQLEAAEDIEVVLVPVNDLIHFLTNPPNGVKVDVKLWSLVHFLGQGGKN